VKTPSQPALAIIVNRMSISDTISRVVIVRLFPRPEDQSKSLMLDSRFQSKSEPSRS
jgi:hypothetical protein